MAKTVQRVVRRNDEVSIDIDERRQTAFSSIGSRDIAPDATRTVAVMITTEADYLRDRVRTLGSDIGHVHQRSALHEWQIRTQERSQDGVADLLGSLADLGFAWRDIARMVGVSVPAIQKWRKGGSSTPEHRRGLARLLAGCDFIVRHREIDDVGQWFEIPLTENVPLTPMDLWAAGEYSLTFEYALHHATAEQVLDRFQPGWRERYSSDFEVFEAGDGQLSIRMKDR